MAKKESKMPCSRGWLLLVIPFLLPYSFAFAGAGKKPNPEGTHPDSVWISRPDGSLQCDAKQGVAHVDPVAAARTLLEKSGVKILEGQKRNDGAMRAQVCGIATGNETTFLILRNDLGKAKSLGFEALP